MLFLLILPVLAGIMLFMFFFLLFSFFQSWKCCLVSNLVSPLLDGLDNLLNDGSLLDLSDWREGISTGFWESKTDMSNWGSDGSSSVGSRGNSMSSIGIGSSIAIVGTGIGQVVSISQLGIGSHRGNSTGTH